ncbi:MAG: hypothetical protein ACLS43_01695 [Evtepia gabavorous]
MDAPVSRDPAALLDKLERLLARLSPGEAVPTLLVREGKPVDFPSGPSSSTAPAREPGLSHLCRPPGRLLPGPGDRRPGAPEGGRISSKPSPRPGAAGPEDGPPGEGADATGDRDRDRMYGDLITANLYRMEKGARVLRTETITTLAAARWWRSRWTP